jgi:cell wall-associated NlpC family hydrolase
MSLPHRRLLAAFVLGGAVVTVAVVVFFVGFERPGVVDTAGAATFEPVRHPERRAPRNAPRFMSMGERAAKVALGAVGIPYRWGGESPSSGFDCSGLVRWAYGRMGIELPHNSYALYAEGRRVSRAGMEPGDVLFFSGLGHVGLYLGRGLMVHAPYSGREVEVVRLARSNYDRRLVGARRVARA